MKFGGTSVEDAGAIDNVVNIIRRSIHRTPFIFVSACAGVTNALQETAQLSSQRNEKARSHFASLYRRHLEISNALFTGNSLRQVKNDLKKSFDELKCILDSVRILGELTPRTSDKILSFGECWSSQILTQALIKIGVCADNIPARLLLTTDNQFSKAEPLWDRTQENINSLLLPKFRSGRVVVTQGFTGATTDDVTTTLGRGGSDYSASIFGALLGAEEIQIWTDTDGILTADPRLVQNAYSLETISYDAAAELSRLGAKVLHPSTIAPAIEKNIPVRVLNSRNPSHPGTLITAQPSNNALPVSITGKKDLVLLTLECVKPFNWPSIARAGVEWISITAGRLSLLADAASAASVAQEMRSYGEIIAERHVASVSVVRTSDEQEGNISADIFAAMNGIRVLQTIQAERSVKLVIGESELENAVSLLHDRLIDFGNSRERDRYDDFRVAVNYGA